MMMQERNTYKNVPIAIVKRFVLNKVEEMDDQQLSRVYEIITGNTCLQKTKENCVNILVNKEHNWK
jgi:hypothetical protein